MDASARPAESKDRTFGSLPHAGLHDIIGRRGRWWIKVSGTCPAKSTVTVYLQAYWCDEIDGCEWITLKSGQADIKPGTSRRANARQACDGTDEVGWRGYVDVNLDGVSDPSGYTYSPPVNLDCVP